MSLQRKITLITGANQGIGFETAKNLLLGSADYHILLGSRDLLKGIVAASSLQSLQIKSTVEPIQLDVTDDSSVDAAAHYVQMTYGHLDILLNNAGLHSQNPSIRSRLRDNLNVNCIGVVSVTEAFLPLLQKSSSPRMVFMSSALGSICEAADPNSMYYAVESDAYRASKSALNMIMVQYWKKLGKEGFKVFLVCPGLIATNLVNADTVRKLDGAEPEVGGERIASVVRGNRDLDVGKFLAPALGSHHIYSW